MPVWEIWLILAVVLGIIELATPTFFFLWFAIGAAIASITSLLIPYDGINIAIFFFVSIVLWLSTRKIVKRLLKSTSKKDIFQESLVGKKATVKKINADNSLIVSVGGEPWKGFLNPMVPISEIQINSELVVEKRENNLLYLNKI